MPNDSTDDIRDAIASTRRLIDKEKAVEHGDNDGHAAYIADLEAHLEKLHRMLAKNEERRRQDVERYGNSH